MRDLNIVPDAIMLSTMMSAAPTAEAVVLLVQYFLEEYPDAVKRHPGCFPTLLSRLRDEHDYVSPERGDLVSGRNDIVFCCANPCGKIEREETEIPP